MDLCIFWTCSLRAKKQIQDVLHIPTDTNVNGETFYSTHNKELIAKLQDLQRRGFIKLRNKTKNGMK